MQSKVIAKSVEIPINYRMVFRNGEWKVYHVITEGVSMLKNYRSQFRQLLAKGSPADLLNKLWEKVNKA